MRLFPIRASSSPNNLLFAAFLLATGLALPALDVSAEEGTWQQWRGPNRDGTIEVEKPWPDDLSSLAPLWRVEVGRGYPGPIVAEDRVFVAETVDGKTEGVRALDRRTGKEIWRASWPGAGKVPFFAARNGDWIRSTPTFDGATLYVGGMEEVFVALDGKTGEERWRVDFPERFGTKVPDFGFSSSPLVDEGFVYVQAANSLVKLDKATGKTVWRALAGSEDMMSNGAFSSPVLTTLAGRRQLVVQTRISLHGIDPESGSVLWSQDVPSFRGMNILTPTIYGDAIFTSTYRNNSFLYRVQPAVEGDESAVSEAWPHKAQAYMSSPILMGDHIYVHLGNGRLTCIDLRTGESTWTSQALGKYWSMVAQGDKILALDEAGTLRLLVAHPEAFQLLDTSTISDQETWGYLAVAGDEIYVRELEAVAAYKWQASTSKSGP